jgi:hypothetical protein
MNVLTDSDLADLGVCVRIAIANQAGSAPRSNLETLVSLLRKLDEARTAAASAAKES